ncbi:hypothetical protein MMC30_003562 [Trapelia coarctata]|nr:hypothetical protein [Trapelia coarctata]
MPDPGLYIDKEHHQFEKRLVRKFAEKQDIDQMCAENFDMYMNFMWGQLTDNVAGVEATRYLESKGVPILASPSDYMCKTKLDFYRASKTGSGFRVPGNTEGKFPKIVKYADGMGSVGLDYDSVCYSQQALDKKMELLKTNEPARDLVIQDFVRGLESTVIVVEMGSEVVALEPVDWVFAADTPVDKAWLTYSNKFEALGEGSIHFEFVTEEPRRTNLRDASVASFKAMGFQGRGCWGRVDMRVEEGTGEIYCLELNHMPAVFYPLGDKLSDDVIIREAYPGGHEAFFDMLLYTKLYQMAQAKKGWAPNGHESSNGEKSAQPNGIADRKETQLANGLSNGNMPMQSSAITDGNETHIANGLSNGSGVPHTNANGSSKAGQLSNSHKPPNDADPWKAKGATIAEVYDHTADKYDSVAATIPFRHWLVKYLAEHDYSGTVLDLACGTGGTGKLIHEAGWDARVSGVDLSPLSLQSAQVKQYYTEPITVGYIQEEIMRAGEYDHITCFGALHFLSRIEFNAAVARMFMLARKSIAFDVDNVSPEYIDLIVSRFGEGLRNHNNVAALKRFGTPKGWRKAVEEEIPLFHSPSVQLDVTGYVVRFERI